MSVSVVNMIPNSMSNETIRDSEPNVSVNPANPLQIAASAFTPDPMGSGTGPIFVSTDGGNTWTLNVIVPGGNRTVDITLRFANTSNVLYAGILRYDSGHNMNILRTNNFLSSTVMDILVDRANEDMPYVEAATVSGGAGVGRDRVYLGHNDFNAPSGRTATVETSLDAATAPAPAGFNPERLEVRGTCGQDGPPIRPAIHPNGTVYAVFFRWTACGSSPYTADVVVVRDDNWASGASPFTDLVDTGDAQPGVRVVTGVSIPWSANLGTQRIGAQMAIAVDPTNSDRVYIAWADGTSASNYTIHIRRSDDRGATWSADLRTITSATNPGLAINTHGKIGFLYQRLVNPGTGDRWETHLETSSDGFASPPTDLILADVPDQNGSYTASNPIGDYACLIAVGKDFYGAFSGNNTPDNANFPNGVVYQRNANFTTHTLLNLDGVTPVPVSIDPFFFKLTGVEPEDDFYVRDWTDNSTSGDTGLEPSTHPVFYTTSDVWNRRGTLPGPFPNDQPSNENAGNGAGNIGDNWAFARIRRNALPAAGSKTVTAHFLVSKLGTGSNYVDAGSVDPDVSFPDPDPTVTFTAADMGPLITPAYHWHLNAVSSSHLCLAVEISAPGDPYVAPSLVGNAPGWPTTDLRIINDNNKAQRNMGLSTTPARGAGMSDCLYAIVHNAATFLRDIDIRYEAAPQVQERLQEAYIHVIGEPSRRFKSGDTITLKNMQPGENRWIGLIFNPPPGSKGEILPVNFYEMVGGTAVNGFAIAAQLAPMTQVIQANLELHRSVFTRMAAGFEIAEAKEEIAAAQELIEKKDFPVEMYLELLQSHLTNIKDTVLALIESQRTKDWFSAMEAVEILNASMKAGEAEPTAVTHTCLLNRLDSFLTMLQLSQGDTADILQNVRWQNDLYTKLPLLARLDCSEAVRAQSEEFITAYGERKIGNRDFPELLRGLLECFHETDHDLLEYNLGLEENIVEIERNLGNLTALQKVHRDLLLKLQSLVKS
jgi:hypothetical protein